MKNRFASIFKIGETIGILVLLNLFWVITVVFGLGITLGSATTAVYDVVRRMTDKEKDEVMLHTCFSIYIKALKGNFKQSTVIWIISAILATMIMMNLRFSIISIGVLAMSLKALQIIILIQLIFTNIYCYGLLATFEANTKRIMYSALLIANAHLFTTLTCIMVAIALVATMKSFNFLTGFILFSMYIYITYLILKPILKKYSLNK